MKEYRDKETCRKCKCTKYSELFIYTAYDVKNVKEFIKETDVKKDNYCDELERYNLKAENYNDDLKIYKEHSKLSWWKRSKLVKEPTRNYMHIPYFPDSPSVQIIERTCDRCKHQWRVLTKDSKFTAQSLKDCVKLWKSMLKNIQIDRVLLDSII